MGVLAMSVVNDLEREQTRSAPDGLRKFRKVNEILAKYHHDPTNLIAILQQVQSEYRYLPQDILTYVATALGQSPSEVYGVATFYSQFSLEPKGKYEIRLCDGTACHVRKSIPVLQAIRQKLKLKPGDQTTRDLRFTVETVSCLGACGLAPVVLINEKVYPQMTPEAVVKVINEINKAEDNRS
jgi:NADH-quinone oxidoreductase subunit E